VVEEVEEGTKAKIILGIESLKGTLQKWNK